MTRLWDRGTPLDTVVARLTVGRDPELDLRLVAHDALASAAHAEMLAAIGILSAEELAGVRAELRTIVGEALAGEFVIDPADEDGHTAIENRLTERLGDAGRRIHTGRSRNDQVIAALRLWGREALLSLHAETRTLVEGLLERAEAERETAVPGYSHTRQAMVTTLGHWLAAHAESLLDDLPWIERAYAHLNRSPLGSASGFGVALDLDRPGVAESLGFDGVQANTLAVQNDRGKSEWLALGAAVAIANDLGRLAGDLIWLSSDELRFVKLPDALTTGSSIMPQKRNPDVLELVRAGAAALRGHHAAIAGVYAPLASGYHRDLQLTKAPFLEGMVLAADLLQATAAVVAGLEVDADRCREAIQPATGATDALYARVARGEPFRSAYRAIAARPEAPSSEAAEGWRSRRHLGAPGAFDAAPERERLERAQAFGAAERERIEAVWQAFESPSV